MKPRIKKHTSDWNSNIKKKKKISINLISTKQKLQAEIAVDLKYWNQYTKQFQKVYYFQLDFFFSILLFFEIFNLEYFSITGAHFHFS